MRACVCVCVCAFVTWTDFHKDTWTDFHKELLMEKGCTGQSAIVERLLMRMLIIDLFP